MVQDSLHSPSKNLSGPFVGATAAGRHPLPSTESEGFRVSGSGCRVQGVGFRVSGSGLRVQGFGLRVQGLGFKTIKILSSSRVVYK